MVDGVLGDGQDVTLRRTSDTSPSFLEDHSSLDDIVMFKQFATETEQAKWIAESIKQHLTSEELKHDDIVVINPDPRTTREKVGLVRRLLWDMGIDNHLAGVDTDVDVFFKAGESSITFTGVFRAKGNEAGMVYVMNAHDCQSSALNLATIRNQLFTAITRSKSWIRVTGVGSHMSELMVEFERLRDSNFQLNFTYPDAEQRRALRIVHRDMSAAERRSVQRAQQGLTHLLQGLEADSVRIEDLDEAAILKLRGLLG